MKKIGFFYSMVLITLMILTGCGSDKSAPGGLNTSFFSDAVTKIGVIHHISGKTDQWTVEGNAVDELKNWFSELQYEPFEFDEGQSPGDGDGGEVYEFTFTEGDFPGFSYVINGKDSCFLFIEGYWYSVSNPSHPPVQKLTDHLTLNQVIELAEKGENLTWSDFERYEGQDIGFGLYILLYPVNEKYNLIIGGVPSEKPWYIRLVSAEDESSYIDIRTDNIQKFID